MTLLIVFIDGTERRVENVETFQYLSEDECFKYHTIDGKFWSWLPKNVIRYIGPEEQWRGIKQQEETNSGDNFWKIYGELLDNISKLKITIDGYRGNNLYNKGWNDALRAVKDGVVCGGLEKKEEKKPEVNLDLIIRRLEAMKIGMPDSKWGSGYDTGVNNAIANIKALYEKENLNEN